MLANGRPFLAIPGPSVVPDRVLRAMHRASPNIYAGEIVAITDGPLSPRFAYCAWRRKLRCDSSGGSYCLAAVRFACAESGRTCCGVSQYGLGAGVHVM